MSKFYVLFPAFLLIVFGVYYTQVAKPEMIQKVAAAQKAEADKAAAEEANRLRIEAKAQEDARRVQEERTKRDRDRDEKARREKEDNDRKIRDETAKWESDAVNYSKQITDLQAQIAALRTQKENVNREVFDAAARVERAKIDRRNAELEIQRMYEMVAGKVNDSFMTKLPPPPPPPK
jgi:predicted  nucleic acid-binding Zn-ribbon protein